MSIFQKGKLKINAMEEQKFGERLKKLRKEANITQNDFADKLLVHSQTVSRWERGIIEPDISQRGEIAATLHVTLEIIRFARKRKNV